MTKLWAKSAPGPDMLDLAMILVAFEAMNNVKVVLSLDVIDVEGRGELVGRASAFDRKTAGTDPTPLASVSVTCSGSHLLSLDAVLIHLMYRLDAALASVELGRMEPK